MRLTLGINNIEHLQAIDLLFAIPQSLPPGTVYINEPAFR
jgi:hypothetical protein